MWDTAHGFISTGQFQHSYNQEEYQPFMFAGNGQSGQEQHSVQQPNAPHPNMLAQQYDSSNDEGSFQSEVGIFSNDGAHTQHQYVNGGAQFPPQTYNMPPRTTAAPRPPTQINARAAELKAELVRRRERKASSATSPVTQKIPALASKQIAPSEEPGSLGTALKTSTTIEKSEQKINVDELISLHSKVADTAARPENKSINTSSFQGIAVHKGAKLQLSPAERIMGAVKPTNLGLVKFLQSDGHPNGISLGPRHTSNGSLSEGEIVEDESTRPRSVPATEPKEIQSSAIVAKIGEAHSRRSRAEQSEKPSPDDRLPRDESPSRRAVAIPKPQGIRSRNDRWEDFDAREKRDYQTFKSDYTERKQYHEPERIVRPRQDSREENHRRTELNERRRSEAFESPPREPPTLKDILPLDEDLREWLEITGYHNAPYRSKILNRRRAIAALDAKRDQLLAEMQAEERGGVPQILEGQVPALSIIPSIAINRAGVRHEPASAAAEDGLERDRIQEEMMLWVEKSLALTIGPTPHSGLRRKSAHDPVVSTTRHLTVVTEPIPVRATIIELGAEIAKLLLAVMVVEAMKAGQLPEAVGTIWKASTIGMMIQSEVRVPLRSEAITEAVHLIQTTEVEVEVEVVGIPVIVETSAVDQMPRVN
ncbi:hypothetical protein BUE80_DR001177 [Diplocarpon rosae]|nr:hypothetical protein BUE80_DR001177 [Diplocarpon rosae]